MCVDAASYRRRAGSGSGNGNAKQQRRADRGRADRHRVQCSSLSKPLGSTHHDVSFCLVGMVRALRADVDLNKTGRTYFDWRRVIVKIEKGLERSVCEVFTRACLDVYACARWRCVATESV